jgi:hypothetical protein
MRQINLTVVKGGIQRLRTKGGASQDTLFDLVNGYVTADQKVRARPGTRRVHLLDPGTKGLVAFGGLFHVFAAEPVAVPEGVRCQVLRHPDTDDDNPIQIREIHFASPFMGALYVVAEFDVDTWEVESERNVFHYWLRGAGNTWKPVAEYSSGQLVEPVTPSGYYYRASRLGTPNPSWTAGQPRQLGDMVEPTTYNEYQYEATFVSAAGARSGSIEPLWPTVSGGQVAEDTSGTEEGDASQPPTPPTYIDPRYTGGS